MNFDSWFNQKFTSFERLLCEQGTPIQTSQHSIEPYDVQNRSGGYSYIHAISSCSLPLSPCITWFISVWTFWLKLSQRSCDSAKQYTLLHTLDPIARTPYSACPRIPHWISLARISGTSLEIPLPGIPAHSRVSGSRISHEGSLARITRTSLEIRLIPGAPPRWSLAPCPGQRL